MLVDDCEFIVDSVSKFHSYVFIEGWFHSSKGDKLIDLSIHGCNVNSVKKTIGFDYGGVLSELGPSLGFRIEVFFDEVPDDLLDSTLSFMRSSGLVINASLSELCSDRLARSHGNTLGEKFNLCLNNIASKNAYRPKVLDIGGRARSGLDRSKAFPGCDVTVIDILPGDNVDVVGDAHELSSCFSEGYFDAVYSVSVFEHLLMPWKVILEINKVLKRDGVGFIFTHQTIGMHDLPWDFFRFSDSAWDSLFNKFTGFEILDRSLDYPTYVIPFILRPDKFTAEKSAGFEGSSILFKKTSDSFLSWNVKVNDIVKTQYPEDVDNTTYGLI
ncbi:class I SAM-dependent methyltransferase [Polynucleobacter sp. AP-Sving-400A-A2]|uniref:class I SAM-dependent methyltransferase n=1 Tax=Polynucleobacter sp. AP-Sving-400A-A2 TaxID=2081049 RepID=UPI001BFE1601|nr:class I SAM-dependent methyltransferase [Polynucleobacter sp. AP-Sving-400A-A2]QWE14871.1 class I SAM-dependent methyltransferase [Polynucleobacter sp. AP-Sving-400A-A2]